MPSSIAAGEMKNAGVITGTVLDTIVARTRNTVAEGRRRTSAAELERRAQRHTPRGFVRSLQAVSQTAPAILAEIKRASPSKGLIREDFQPAQLARQLARGGAAALSVLTDEPFFQGSLAYLEQASQAVEIPCLRKDFMVDAYQVVEARAHCADAILLIAAALSDAELETLAKEAHGFGLDVLCEVHTHEELDRVLGLNQPMDAIGVNSRDLKTFSVSLERAVELGARLPQQVLRVAESGIYTAEDIQRLRGAGYQAFLIGESLMRQPDPGVALEALLKGGR